MKFSVRTLLPALALLCSSLILPAALPAVQRYTQAHQLVDDSTKSLHQFIIDPGMQSFRDLAKRAHGILIVPQMWRGGLVLGGTSGAGILLVRDWQTGQWRGPAFYTFDSITFGLQVGAEASQVVMLAMTERGVRSLLASSFKIGADVTMAAGPVGGGTKATTADILAYSKSKGAFGGFTVEGALMRTMDGWNTGYYGSPASPRQILISGDVVNEQAAGLREKIASIAAPQTQKVDY